MFVEFTLVTVKSKSISPSIRSIYFTCSVLVYSLTSNSRTENVDCFLRILKSAREKERKRVSESERERESYLRF